MSPFNANKGPRRTVDFTSFAISKPENSVGPDLVNDIVETFGCMLCMLCSVRCYEAGHKQHKDADDHDQYAGA